eukprot:TRINITY_DN2031_c0_g1_i6.p1 TRINITY_DN2031_c0_g1~~TRINITY_DN2031_c0_g1_i6.p1  ORF type:complete len:1016 (+),score=253.66 TRINITY_DN2031_c0_g1_i6:71-3049(+)
MALPELEDDMRRKYQSLYSENKDGVHMSGARAKTLFAPSGLDNVSLQQIWRIADVDKDGSLDMDEFVVAMYLILLRKKHGRPLPASAAELPRSVVPATKMIQLQGSVPQQQNTDPFPSMPSVMSMGVMQSGGSLPSFPAPSTPPFDALLAPGLPGPGGPPQLPSSSLSSSMGGGVPPPMGVGGVPPIINSNHPPPPLDPSLTNEERRIKKSISDLRQQIMTGQDALERAVCTADERKTRLQNALSQEQELQKQLSEQKNMGQSVTDLIQSTEAMATDADQRSKKLIEELNDARTEQGDINFKISKSLADAEHHDHLMQELQADLRTISNELHKGMAELSEKESIVARLQNQKFNLHQELSAIETSLGDAYSKNKNKDTEIADLKQSISDLQESITKASSRVEEYGTGLNSHRSEVVRLTTKQGELTAALRGYEGQLVTMEKMYQSTEKVSEAKGILQHVEAKLREFETLKSELSQGDGVGNFQGWGNESPSSPGGWDEGFGSPVVAKSASQVPSVAPPALETPNADLFPTQPHPFPSSSNNLFSESKSASPASADQLFANPGNDLFGGASANTQSNSKENSPTGSGNDLFGTSNPSPVDGTNQSEQSGDQIAGSGGSCDNLFQKREEAGSPTSGNSPEGSVGGLFPPVQTDKGSTDDLFSSAPPPVPTSGDSLFAKKEASGSNDDLFAKAKEPQSDLFPSGDDLFANKPDAATAVTGSGENLFAVQQSTGSDLFPAPASDNLFAAKAEDISSQPAGSDLFPAPATTDDDLFKKQNDTQSGSDLFAAPAGDNLFAAKSEQPSGADLFSGPPAIPSAGDGGSLFPNTTGSETSKTDLFSGPPQIPEPENSLFPTPASVETTGEANGKKDMFASMPSFDAPASDAPPAFPEPEPVNVKKEDSGWMTSNEEWGSFKQSEGNDAGWGFQKDTSATSAPATTTAPSTTAATSSAPAESGWGFPEKQPAADNQGWGFEKASGNTPLDQKDDDDDDDWFD